MGYKVAHRERIYFGIKAIIALILWFCVALALYSVYQEWSYYPETKIQELRIFGIYLSIFILFHLIGHIMYMGYLKANAVKITQKQFPEIYSIVEEHSKTLKMKVPTVYLMQSNGLLNAFATRLFGKHYVILYSNLLEAAYEEGEDAIKFIVGHELGHIKRRHLNPYINFLLVPSKIVPFLGKAYSRACEYTCDNIGFFLSPKGASNGLLILAAGIKLYKKVDIEEYLANAKKDRGFATWFAEIFSTHPHLSKRISSITVKAKASNNL